MSTGDAIIAATAKLHQIPVYTGDLEGFKNIEGLEVVNPFSS